MKPSFQHLGFDAVDASFLCYPVKSNLFGFHWHYHLECEISYVVKGYGTRLIGDNVEEFKAGDLLLLGPELPHTLISDELFNQSGEEMEVIVVQFRKEIIEARSMEIVELGSIGELIKESYRGLKFEDAGSFEIGEKLKVLPTLSGFKQYHLLLDILNDLAHCEHRSLASVTYVPNKSSDSEARISKVCSYIHLNYTHDIEISELAELAAMNESSFCRYFKKMTGKTAMNYINDLRIGMACQLLHSDNYSISEAAYQSGYNSITHFNRCFRKRKSISPTEYRKHYANQ